MAYKLYDIGNRIEKLRKAKGWSQNRLSIESGLAVNSVYLYEAQGTIPTLISICSIAEALGVTVGYLIGEED